MLYLHNGKYRYSILLIAVDNCKGSANCCASIWRLTPENCNLWHTYIQYNYTYTYSPKGIVTKRSTLPPVAG